MTNDNLSCLLEDKGKKIKVRVFALKGDKIDIPFVPVPIVNFRDEMKYYTGTPHCPSNFINYKSAVLITHYNIPCALIYYIHDIPSYDLMDIMGGGNRVFIGKTKLRSNIFYYLNKSSSPFQFVITYRSINHMLVIPLKGLSEERKKELIDIEKVT